MDRGAVVVVLVFGGLLGLGLDEQGALEADLVLVLSHHRQESGELVGLLAQTGIEQSLVTLSASPQHVVGPIEAVGGLKHVADLGGGMGEHLGIGVGGRTGGVAGVAEQVGRAPQQSHPGGLHLGRGPLHRGIEVGPALGQVGALGGHVHIVEAEERGTQLLEELEGSVLLGPGGGHRVLAGLQPGAVKRADAEDVTARPIEAVPVAHGHPEVVLHAPPEHLPVGVIHPVGGAALAGILPGEGHRLGHRIEEVGHGVLPVMG